MGARGVIGRVLVLATPVVVGCGSSHALGPGIPAGGGAEPGDGAGGGNFDASNQAPTEDGGGVAAACDDLLAAWVACSLLPSAAEAHLAPRFRQVCEIQTSLPGSTTTASLIESCARATASDCSTFCQFPLTGTLAPGAPCNVDFDYQCQSGSCSGPQLADGGYAACGTCAPGISVGQPCGGGVAGNCVPLSACVPGASPMCVAYGTAGATCSLSLPCQANLFCSATNRCAPQESAGASCSAAGECAGGLPCVAGACAQPLPAGAACTHTANAAPCGPGLICDGTTSTCVASTVEPGGACGSNGRLCLFGSCSKTGVCPTLIPDGQPCPADDTQTCDVEAECSHGKCAIPGTTVCR